MLNSLISKKLIVKVLNIRFIAITIKLFPILLLFVSFQNCSNPKVNFNTTESQTDLASNYSTDLQNQSSGLPSSSNASSSVSSSSSSSTGSSSSSGSTTGSSSNQNSLFGIKSDILSLSVTFPKGDTCISVAAQTACSVEFLISVKAKIGTNHRIGLTNSSIGTNTLLAADKIRNDGGETIIYRGITSYGNDQLKIYEILDSTSNTATNDNSILISSKPIYGIYPENSNYRVSKPNPEFICSSSKNYGAAASVFAVGESVRCQIITSSPDSMLCSHTGTNSVPEAICTSYAWKKNLSGLYIEFTVTPEIIGSYVLHGKLPNSNSIFNYSITYQ